MSSLPEFKKWLDAYGAAWENGDADAAAALFTEDAAYHETPFDEPMTGIQAIHRYWTEGAAQSQKDVAFSYEALAVVGNVGLARWHASFVRIRTGKRVELDGFLLAEFAAAGKCAVFREWWHRRESVPERGEQG